MEYAEAAGLSILTVVQKLFKKLFGGEYSVVIIAVRKTAKEGDSYAIISDLDVSENMEQVLTEAARRSRSGTMLTNDDNLETKH